MTTSTSKDSSCFENNEFFSHERKGGIIVLLRKGPFLDAAAKIAEDPEKFLDDAEIVKDSRTTKAGIIILGDGRKLFLKRYNTKGLRYALRYMFRKARPFRAWQNSWECEQRGMPVPRPVMAMVVRKAGIIGRSYLAVEHVDAIPTLEFCSVIMSDPGRKRICVETVCKMFADLHDAGIVHGDAKFSNIFVKRKGFGYTYGLWDLDAMTCGRTSAAADDRTIELARIASSLVEISVRLGKPLDLKSESDLFISQYERLAGVELDRTLFTLTAKRLLSRKTKGA